jgi:hypothetical protein
MRLPTELACSKGFIPTSDLTAIAGDRKEPIKKAALSSSRESFFRHLKRAP